MKALYAHPVVINTQPAQAGFELAMMAPSWMAIFNDPTSFGQRFLHAPGAALERYRIELEQWAFMSTPFSAEPMIRQVVDGASVIAGYPPVLMRTLDFYEIVEKNEIVKIYGTTNGYRRQLTFFPNLTYFIDYMNCTAIDHVHFWSCLYTYEIMDAGEVAGSNRYMLFSMAFDTIEIFYSGDDAHPDGYSITITKDQLKRSHIWNQLDDWGYEFALDRNPEEHDLFFARRLNDIFNRPGHAAAMGIRNGISRELGLMVFPGQFRVPVVFPNIREDQFGDKLRTQESRESVPRILECAKWNLQTPPLPRTETMLKTSEYLGLDCCYVIFKVTGPGHLVLKPIPDHVYSFASAGFDNDPSFKIAYRATIANGFNGTEYVHDQNICTLEVNYVEPANYVPPTDGHDPYARVAYFILEYRNRISRVMPDYLPVDYVRLKEWSFERVETPQALEYILLNLFTRNFAINDTFYKACHFQGFAGPADFTPEQEAHYLGLGSSVDFMNTHQQAPLYATWHRRHEAFTEVTEQGMNRMTHEHVAEMVNDATRVMWGKWRWGEGFWWEESVLVDPYSTLQYNTPLLENCLEYVPHFCDTEFRSRDKML